MIRQVWTEVHQGYEGDGLFVTGHIRKPHVSGIVPLRSTEIEGKDAELSPGSSGNEVLASPKWFRDTDELNKELDAIKLDFTNKINTVREKYLINGYGLIVVAGSPNGKSEISFVIDMGSVKV